MAGFGEAQTGLVVYRRMVKAWRRFGPKGENKLDDFHQLSRGTEGEVWKGRFFDRELRTVKEYTETVEYIHLNPVRRDLVRRAEDWTWSSAREYAGVSPEEQERRCGLTIDRIRLPADENTTI